MDKRPGPNARVVGRGRISAVPIWALILLVGVSGIVLGGTAMALIVGVPFTLVALFGLGTVIHARVWVDGPVLYSRTVFGYRPPIRLDALRDATLTEPSRNQGPLLLLTAQDGTVVRLDATNLRLVRLYAALGQFIGPFDRVANERLRERVEKYRY